MVLITKAKEASFAKRGTRAGYWARNFFEHRVRREKFRIAAAAHG